VLARFAKHGLHWNTIFGHHMDTAESNAWDG